MFSGEILIRLGTLYALYDEMEVLINSVRRGTV